MIVGSAGMADLSHGRRKCGRQGHVHDTICIDLVWDAGNRDQHATSLCLKANRVDNLPNYFFGSGFNHV